MRLVAIVCVGLFLLFYIAVAFVAAKFDEGIEVTGWRRWVRFVALLPIF